MPKFKKNPTPFMMKNSALHASAKYGSPMQDSAFKMKGWSPFTKKGDLSKMPFFSKERIAEYKKRDWAPDHTTDRTKTAEYKTLISNLDKKFRNKGKLFDEEGNRVEPAAE